MRNASVKRWMNVRSISAPATIALVGVLILGRCTPSTTIALKGGEIAPAAEGAAVVKVGPNGNTELSISVKHLANPQDVDAGTHQYVVWVQPLGADPHAQNAGTLALDDNLKGRLDTLTALHDFDMFITPENTGTVPEPHGRKVLQAHITRNE